MFVAILAEKAKEAGIILSAKQLEDFARYFDLLLEANKDVNLTAITEPEDFAVKHIIDCLGVFDERFFPAGAFVCDVGSGAGFPGIPLKIFRPELKIVLLDSLDKRLRFLDTVIVQLKLENIYTCHIRAEDAGRSGKHRAVYDVATARAVAPLNVLSEYCLPLLKTGGFFCAMKGRQCFEEIAAANPALKKLGGEVAAVKHVTLPGLPDERRIVYIQKSKNTPARYPRKAGQPDKQPL